MSAAIQPMPPLTAEQLEALRADIAEHGVLVPVVIDQHGRILDGNNRAAVAAELGIDYPTQTVIVSDDDDAHDRAVTLNCSRRHLNREQVRELIASEIRRRPDDSDRAIARRVGCSPTTVGTIRAELRAQIDAEAERQAAQTLERIENTRGMLAMQAALRHRDGLNWQAVGDVLERSIWAHVSNMDSDFGNVDDWAASWGRLFDEIRAADCAPDCAVCTDADRRWRDDHPRQVYRWSAPDEVSKLDTRAVIA